MPKAVAPSAPSATLIEASALADLDFSVGRYLRGDVVAYRGEANVQDNAGVIGDAAQKPTITDGTFPEGPVMAGLEFRPARPSDYSPFRPNVSGDVAFLSLSSALAHKQVTLSQALTDPSLTEASQIGGGLVSACTSCAPNLWSRPKAIVLDDMTTSGVFSVLPPSGPAVDVTLHTLVSARLTFAPPCSLSYDELVVLNGSRLNGAIPPFQQEGSEMVQHISTHVPARYIGGACVDDTPYTMDVFIDLTDLGHYGVRNLNFGPPNIVCVHE
jgi:hypothetical protein